jgi:hypothetical protein
VGEHAAAPRLIPPGALPPARVLAAMGVMAFPAPEIANAAQAQSMVARLIEDGVDGIRLFVSSPRSEALRESTMCAAVQEAHRSSTPVFAHPESGADITAALAPASTLSRIPLRAPEHGTKRFSRR